MKNNLLIILAISLSLFLFSCDSDDENPADPNSGGGGTGSTLSAEGYDFEFGLSGNTTTLSSDELFKENFDGSRNIAGFFKLLSFPTDEGTLFFRTHFGQEYDREKDWQDDMGSSDGINHGLYNYQYRQEWTPELVGTASTLSFVSGDYNGEYFGGDITVYRDRQTNAGVYSLWGVIDARLDNGQTLKGDFWAKEFDWGN